MPRVRACTRGCARGTTEGSQLTSRGKRRFGPWGFFYRIARIFIGGPEFCSGSPYILSEDHGRCPLCSALWKLGCPIGEKEISSKELAKRSGRSQSRVNRLLLDARIACNLRRPRRIPILRRTDCLVELPDRYAWCPLCSAVWATGAHWVGDGCTPKELSRNYGVSIQVVYQAIYKGELRLLMLRTGGWWAPPWEVADMVRRNGWVMSEVLILDDISANQGNPKRNRSIETKDESI